MEIITPGLTHEEKELLILGSVARDEKNNLTIDEKMDPYTEEDLIP